MASLDDLDSAFTLPDTISNEKLRGLYEVLVHRMRKEAEGIPMNTIQQLLIERIAYNYVVMRSKEFGDSGGFVSANAQRDYNQFWLSMTAEFNRLVHKNAPMDTGSRKALIREVQQIIIGTLTESVADAKLRSSVLGKMSKAFEAVKV